MTKRPTSCMLILPKPVKGEAEADAEFAELFIDVSQRVKAALPAFF